MPRCREYRKVLLCIYVRNYWSTEGSKKFICSGLNGGRLSMRKIEYFDRNKTLLADGNGERYLAEKNKINLNWWHIKYNQNIQNFGDMLSPVIFDYMCKFYGLDKNAQLSKTKHFYGVGSILFFENQDATVWGTGCAKDLDRNFTNFFHQKCMRKLDVRAVRGPHTRDVLMKFGIRCPEIYGDPAMLMPLIYSPNVIQQKEILVLTNMKDSLRISNSKDIIVSNVVTYNWKSIIDLIASSRLVISSSLHGIIVSESYGIPAILLRPKTDTNLFKYEDYYLGTSRNNFIVVDSIEEGMRIDVSKLEMPNVSQIQDRLIQSFPMDLW